MTAPAAYYGNVNPDLLAWMPLSAGRVLELGCGEGALAAAYKARNPRAHYTAVELHGPAAAVARGRVDRLHEGDFAALDLAELAADGPFDLAVMGDVLEHMADPWAVLRRLRELLAPDGVLAISVPNVGHWSVLAEAMAGRWPAEDAGLFDRTHLRWFTLDSLGRTLGDTGFALRRARPRNFLLNREAAERWIPALADAAERGGVERRGFVERAQALQYVANARRADAPAEDPLHVHFAAVTPDFLDVRMRQPMEALRSDPGVTTSWRERDARLPDLPAGRRKVAVVQRLALTADAAAAYAQAARHAGWALVFEMDDHPDLIGRVQRSDAGTRLVETLCAFDAVQTSTAALGDALAAYARPVRVFANALMELPPLAPRAPGPPRVFYGALNREGFSAEVARALGPFVARRPDVEFTVVHDRAFFDALPTGAKRFHPAAPYADYLGLMRACDVVLSPLEGRPEERFKSDVKWLEATRAGAAFLASPPVYAATVASGSTGVIVEGPDGWGAALDALLGAPDHAAALAAAARAEVAATRMEAFHLAARIEWYGELADVARRRSAG